MMEIDVLACRGCGKYIGCTCLTLEQHEAHIATLEAQLSEAREELARLNRIVAMDTLLQIDGELYDAARPQNEGE